MPECRASALRTIASALLTLFFTRRDLNTPGEQGKVEHSMQTSTSVANAGGVERNPFPNAHSTYSPPPRTIRRSRSTALQLIDTRHHPECDATFSHQSYVGLSRRRLEQGRASGVPYLPAISPFSIACPMQRPSRVPGHLHDAHSALLQMWLHRRSRLEVASDSVITAIDKTRLVRQGVALHPRTLLNATVAVFPCGNKEGKTIVFTPRCTFHSCLPELCLGLAAPTKKRASGE